MAITINPYVCASYKSECFQGTHTSTGPYKIALLKAQASGGGTYDYTFTNAGTPGSGAPSTSNIGTDEATGTGYTTGGATLATFTVGTLGKWSYLTFSTDPSWASSTITSCGAVIYDSGQGNKAVAVFGFGSNGVAGDKSSSNGAFTVDLGNASLTGTGIAFSNGGTITDSGNGLAVFLVGHTIITNSTNNPGPFTVTASAAGSLTVTPAPATESAGPSFTLKSVLIAW